MKYFTYTGTKVERGAPSFSKTLLESGTEYDYNMLPAEKKKDIIEIRTIWFHSFGVAYWRDVYSPVWHPVVKKTYNIVLLFVRIQIVYR